VKEKFDRMARERIGGGGKSVWWPMSAIPSTGVNFDFTGNASGLNKTVTESEKRIARLASEAKRAKVDIPVSFNIAKRLEREALQRKSLIWQVQRKRKRRSARARVAPVGRVEVAAGSALLHQ
jgi:hypothetical protein